MSNTERQRRFRAANPNYFNKYNNRKKARRIAGQKKAMAIILENMKARMAQAQPATPLTLLPKMPLMLPAPVQDPLMAEIDALAASLAARNTGDCQSAPFLPPREAA